MGEQAQGTPWTLDTLVSTMPERRVDELAEVDLSSFFDSPTGQETVKFKEPDIEDIYASAKDAEEILKIEEYAFWSREQAIAIALLGLCHVYPPVEAPPTIGYCKMAVKNPAAILLCQQTFYTKFPWLKNLRGAIEEKKSKFEGLSKKPSSLPRSATSGGLRRKSGISDQAAS